MAGVSDVVYRSICADYNAAFTYTEMISALGLHYSPHRCKEIRLRGEKEKLCGIQLFGDDPKIMAQMAKEYGQDFDIIDVNMGCPAPKIVKNNQGSALMKDIKKSKDIIKAIVDKVDKPVTAKIRTGWDENSINAVEFAQNLETAGISAITVHGRHAKQFYSGTADLSIIAKVKEHVKIPVIGNGDIYSADDAKNMLDKTKCDAVMVARGALGNPFIFRQIYNLLNNTEPYIESCNEKKDIILYHATKLCKLFGERHGVLKMRKHLGWYLKGTRNASRFKSMAVKVNTLDDIKSCLFLVFDND